LLPNPDGTWTNTESSRADKGGRPQLATMAGGLPAMGGREAGGSAVTWDDRR